MASLANVGDSLSTFEKNKSIEDIQNAVEAMEKVPPVPSKIEKTSPVLAERQRQTEMWLNILAVIEKNLDANFEAYKDFQLNIVPPRSDGVRLPSGVDPNAIKDPAARAEYEAAKASNRDKAERYSFQLRLHRISRHVTVDVQRALASMYDSSASDRSELENLLSKVQISAPVKDALKNSAIRGDR